MFTASRSLLLFLLTLALLAAQPASATTIDPLLPEELILGADLVAVVECEQAGGIVATYKVIESWKGAEVGTPISLRVAVNYWEPQFPITLVGERYFVTAYKEAPSRIMSTTSGGGVPLWWRKLPSDYGLPLFQGRVLLGAEGGEAEAAQRLRNLAATLLKASPEEQEGALLKAVIGKTIFGKKWLGGETDEAKARDLETRLNQHGKVSELVDDLLLLAKNDPEKWKIRVGITLTKGAGDIAFTRLKNLTMKNSPWDEKELKELIQEIGERRAKADETKPRASREPKPETVPDAAKLAKLREALAKGERGKSMGEAFEVLPKHDPGAMADYLIKWQNPNESWRDRDQGYVLGSYFAWKCGGDRKKHLTVLLGAKDPFIRVAGAVYLCFEDAEAGTRALGELSKLDGDPGVWAALTLARRGNKDAVPRALLVFKPREDAGAEEGGMAGVPHGNLEKRVLVLLSNSAKASGAPQPVLPRGEAERWEYLNGWWKENAARLVIADPWSPELEKQKVD